MAEKKDRSSAKQGGSSSKRGRSSAKRGRSSAKQAEEFARRAHLLSHDLRNPIGTILGYVDLLRGAASDVLDEEQQNFLDRIEANCTQMLRELVRFTEISDRQAEEE